MIVKNISSRSTVSVRQPTLITPLAEVYLLLNRFCHGL
jgi:hypothetical protein